MASSRAKIADLNNQYDGDRVLREAFPGWQVERLASYDRDVDEGRGHSGRSALIDFIARKPA